MDEDENEGGAVRKADQAIERSSFPMGIGRPESDRQLRTTTNVAFSA
jgi:hypothetical protein